MAFNLASLFGGNITAPQLNFNTAAGQAQLAAGNSMGAGFYNNGIKAFLPGTYNVTEMPNWNNASDESGRNENQFYENTLKIGPEARALTSNINNATQQLGIDTSKFNGSNYRGLASNFGPGGPAMQGTNADNYLSSISSGNMNAPGLTDLYGDLNNQLKDWSRVYQASSGWDGKNNARSTAETLYHQSSPGVWDAVGGSKFGVRPEHQGWAKEDGADLIAAISVMLPAVGGWAGLANSALGTTGTALSNAAVNAAGGALMSGDARGMIGGLGGALGSAGGGALGNALGGYGQVGSQLGGLLGRYATTGQTPSLGSLFNAGRSLYGSFK